MTDITNTLAERGKRYGEFKGHAEVTQALKQLIKTSLYAREKRLAPDQQEALDMICHKIGRIINGDPDYNDSWVDIAGYAKLVADRLQKGQEPKERKNSAYLYVSTDDGDYWLAGATAEQVEQLWSNKSDENVLRYYMGYPIRTIRWVAREGDTL